jgi:hypothetical protein
MAKTKTPKTAPDVRSETYTASLKVELSASEIADRPPH